MFNTSGSSSERTELRRPFHSESFPIRVSVSRHSNWFRWIPSGRNIEDAKSAPNGYSTARLMETSKTTLSVPGTMGCQSRQPARLSDTVYSEAEVNAGTVTRGDEDGDGNTRDRGKTGDNERDFVFELHQVRVPAGERTAWPATPGSTEHKSPASQEAIVADPKYEQAPARAAVAAAPRSVAPIASRRILADILVPPSFAPTYRSFTFASLSF
ncbi:hypothetical protein CABS01_15582 [Colletotrichum abscissum]|uniref:Uncharacterized protein n=1 Tax=Colletotrichum abscissum TaxID=1671311 RepID=A0A9Q0ATE6_9PEZI|nr:uncharacterized protein CABS01_15582 [Colletotrichum abscissum]KAI3530346.1 hypothetical protein CABS02_14531 [Colletotrichum abscissum]KAK1475876.1 hypothetical protein CABS01_15582 [Colletotrichum abscissum]